jgi:LCP family protein required for cell wall assembly
MIPDPTSPTQPTRRPAPLGAPATQTQPGGPARRRRFLSRVLLAGLLLGLALGAYFFAPFRTNILLLGIDRSPEGTALGRSDTLILATVLPLRPYVGMLSIPRDLWVTIPGGSQNRINTAHFFAEEAQPGSGPEAAMETVRTNFGVDVDYYVRIQFDGIKAFVDALGGLAVDLDAPAAGLDAGRHVLTGEQALAFVRYRQGGDDFTRIGDAQLFLRAVLRQLLRPASWLRLPLALTALIRSARTDVPLWMWPRLGLSVLRLGPGGIDFRSITREMVQPFTTAGGASVLAPDWALINPVLLEMFGQ